MAADPVRACQVEFDQPGQEGMKLVMERGFQGYNTPQTDSIVWLAMYVISQYEKSGPSVFAEIFSTRLTFWSRVSRPCRIPVSIWNLSLISPKVILPCSAKAAMMPRLPRSDRAANSVLGLVRERCCILIHDLGFGHGISCFAECNFQYMLSAPAFCPTPKGMLIGGSGIHEKQACVLSKAAKREEDLKVGNRILAVHGIKSGCTIVDVANMRYVTEQTARNWAQNFKETGIGSIRDLSGKEPNP